MAKTSWIGTSVVWTPASVDGLHSGKAALVELRRPRLPWYRGKYLLAVVANQKLMLFKGDRLPQDTLCSNDTLLTIGSSELTLKLLAEYFEWPDIQAVHDGYLKTDLAQSFEPQRWLRDGILQRFHKEPLPGWWPVHRGALGISFLRNVMEGTNCAEITSTALNLYRGPIADNEALQENRIFKRFGVHEMEVNALHDVLPDVDEVVQVRLMMRKYLFWQYEFCQDHELPF
jgi:hypothetical protein